MRSKPATSFTIKFTIVFVPVYCLLYVEGLTENLPVILQKILDGPHLACSMPDVNLPSNTGLGAACEKEH